MRRPEVRSSLLVSPVTQMASSAGITSGRSPRRSVMISALRWSALTPGAA